MGTHHTQRSTILPYIDFYAVLSPEVVIWAQTAVLFFCLFEWVTYQPQRTQKSRAKKLLKTHIWSFKPWLQHRGQPWEWLLFLSVALALIIGENQYSTAAWTKWCYLYLYFADFIICSCSAEECHRNNKFVRCWQLHLCRKQKWSENRRLLIKTEKIFKESFFKIHNTSWFNVGSCSYFRLACLSTWLHSTLFKISLPS